MDLGWNLDKLFKEAKLIINDTSKIDLEFKIFFILAKLNELILNNNIELFEPKIEKNDKDKIIIIWNNNKTKKSILFLIEENIFMLMNYISNNNLLEFNNPKDTLIIKVIKNFLN